MPSAAAVAVVGAGRLGIRHLESLCAGAMPARVYAIDPSREALAAAARHIDALQARGADLDVVYADSFEGLPSAIDVAIVSTTADVRLAATERLLAHASVRHLVLEKVLFQRVDHYGRAKKLFERHGMHAWVNCPRRMYPIYRALKDRLQHDAVRLVAVAGSEWGLACNAVHFADLFQFLTGGTVDCYALALDEEIKASKRKGFVEFTGVAHGEASGARLFLASVSGASPKFRVTLLSNRHYCTIDEDCGVAEVFEDSRLAETVRFETPKQSELTAVLVSELLTSGRCDLPSYDDSMAAHLPLITAFLAAGGARAGANEIVAIT